MRAVAIANDRSLQPTEVEEFPLGPEEVRIAVAFCGICGTDLHGRTSPILPVGAVMGHEFSGTITELGAVVEGLSVGDRVTVFPSRPCGECVACRRGDEYVCQQAAVMGLGLGASPGAFAESVIVHGSMVFRIPGSLSFEHAALVEPLSVALHGIGIGETRPEDTCVVIGAGPIGVMTALALRARGVGRVLVVERNERRQEGMRSLGVDAIGLDDVHAKVMEACDGGLPDIVFECAGNPAAPQLAAELVRPRGIVVLLGAMDEPAQISQLLLIIKEVQMRASFAYRPDEFKEAIDLLSAGRLPADRLITHVAPLDQAQAMFERLEDAATKDIKILLRASDGVPGG